MGSAIRKPIPDTQNTRVDMTKPRNALQKRFQMIQSNFYHKSDPYFLRFFRVFVFRSLVVHYVRRYHIDQYVILLLIYPRSVTENIMRIR